MLSIKNLFETKGKKKLTRAEAFNDLFRCNIKYLPDTSFEKLESGRMINGRHYTVYYKELKKKECDLFDFIEVKIHRDFERKNISFIATDASSVNLQALAQFVNTCEALYRTDHGNTGGGKFNAADLEQIADTDWEGRTWARAEMPKLTLYMQGGNLVLNMVH